MHFLAALLLKSKSATAEKAAIAAYQGLEENIISNAQAVASSAAVSQGYLIIGFVVAITGVVALAIKFSTEDEKVADGELKQSLEDLIPVGIKS